MNKYAQNEEGYIVFEEGGTCLFNAGASERWFPTYDKAMAYAMSIVNERIDKFKKVFDLNSVIVYEAPESLTHQSHACPPKGHRIVFTWSNYNKNGND